MTTVTSTITSMFNRLPIYIRPKEPAIGYPTLTESTNTNLTGLGGRPIPLPSIGGNPNTIGYKIASFKGLPDIPSLGTSLRDDNEESEEDAIRPPAPLKTKHPSSSASSPRSQNTIEKMDTFRLPQRKCMQRKPPPGNPSFSPSAELSSETIRGGSTPQEYSIAPTTNRRGFGLGSVVREKVSGRRRPADVPSYHSETNDAQDPLEASLPFALTKPPNFISIDDWLHTREREGLHRRSNTVTTVNTVATRYNDPARLHIRQSTFAPLPTPHEVAPRESTSTIPQIPNEYLTSISNMTPPALPPQLTQGLPALPKTPSNKDAQPRDHIEQLEYDQEQLTSRRSDIRREMWHIQQLLPPHPSTHNPSAREDMNRRLVELAQELAYVEKEMHETGMRLHRAWRRRDKKMGVEGPTHLWVSRAIGP